jgi:hypothetical protein
MDVNGTPYTSDLVKDWTKLGYQYDTLEKPRVLRLQPGDRSSVDHLTQLKRVVNLKYNATRSAVLNAPDIHGKENDYLINIIYDRLARSLSTRFLDTNNPE